VIHVFFYEIRLLSPLFYATRPDSGSAGATTTDPWIGDLALMYAINSSLGLKSLHFKYTENTPFYNEVLDLPYITSVASPSLDVKYTRVYDTATSFISQGYFNKDAFDKSANAPMRNWLKRQGISPGNVFVFGIATNGEWLPPEEFTVRLGNMKETLASCKRIKNFSGWITVNLYTIMLVLNRLGKDYNGSQIVKALSPNDDGGQSLLEYIMPQYILVRSVVPEKWLSYLEGFY
jgi:CRISPR type I-D-associated protein Csc1